MARFPASDTKYHTSQLHFVFNPFHPCIAKQFANMQFAKMMRASLSLCQRLRNRVTHRLWPRQQAESVWEGQSKFLTTNCLHHWPGLTPTAGYFLFEAARFSPEPDGCLPWGLILFPQLTRMSPPQRGGEQDWEMVEHTSQSIWGPQTWSRI